MAEAETLEGFMSGGSYMKRVQSARERIPNSTNIFSMSIEYQERIRRMQGYVSDIHSTTRTINREDVGLMLPNQVYPERTQGCLLPFCQRKDCQSNRIELQKLLALLRRYRQIEQGDSGIQVETIIVVDAE